MKTNTQVSKLSVVVTISSNANSAASLFPIYKAACASLAEEVEFIYVVNTQDSAGLSELKKLKEEEPSVHLIILNRVYGEGTALQAGFDQASGDLILTLPPYLQVELDEIPKLFEKIDEFPVVLARRWPRVGSSINRTQSKVFNWFITTLSNQTFSDLGCEVRLIRAEVIREVHIYGEQHRFFPLLAYQLGFLNTEVDLKQATSETHRVHKPRVYLRRALDVVTIVFLTKFNKKPLRFFGLIGFSSISLGFLGLLYMAFQRLFLDMEMGDRPLMVMFCLFLVLGVQLMAIGLVGETVTFTNATKNKEYRIKEIIE